MRGTAVLNRQSGGLREIDLDDFSDRLRTAFAASGHDLAIRVVEGRDLPDTLERIGDDPDSELLVAAGGDGTLSAAAGIAWRKDKVFGALPGGTMNLVSRSLRLPQNPHDAIDALAAGQESRIDIATANERPFLHEFSAGFRPRMVKTRQAFHYSSRLGKVLASLRALLITASRPPVLDVMIETDTARRRETASLIAISNNLYGKGHFPYADRLDEGTLGLYQVGLLGRRRGFRLTTALIVGNWQENPDVTITKSRRVHLSFEHLSGTAHCIVDGELASLEAKVTLQVHPGALRCLMPRIDTPHGSLRDFVTTAKAGGGGFSLPRRV